MPVRRLVKQLLKPEGGYPLDLCCGTGIIAELICDFPSIAYIGVDINHEFLKRARERMTGFEHFQFLAADLLSFDLDRKFDIILMINGYHHFKNPVKPGILRKVHELLKSAGSFVVYEMCIAKNKTRVEFARANEEFYRKRIEWNKKNEQMTPKKLAAWQNLCDLSSSAEDEYKVDYDYLIRDFQTNGFVNDQVIRIWPPPGEQLFEDPRVGDFLLLFRKNNQE
jgi:ubiquinone/menaquinone biosynthesis C-methylase UbiE